MKLEDVAKSVIDDAKEQGIDLLALDAKGDDSFDKEFDNLTDDWSSWNRDSLYHEELRDEVLKQLGAWVEIQGTSGADIHRQLKQMRGESVVKLTKKDLKRIVAEESTKLNREIDFGSNAERQKKLQEVEYHGDPVVVAFKNVANEISAAEAKAKTRSEMYFLIDEIQSNISNLQTEVDAMSAAVERGEYQDG